MEQLFYQDQTPGLASLAGAKQLSAAQLTLEPATWQHFSRVTERVFGAGNSSQLRRALVDECCHVRAALWADPRHGIESFCQLDGVLLSMFVHYPLWTHDSELASLLETLARTWTAVLRKIKTVGEIHLVNLPQLQHVVSMLHHDLMDAHQHSELGYVLFYLDKLIGSGAPPLSH